MCGCVICDCSQCLSLYEQGDRVGWHFYDLDLVKNGDTDKMSETYCLVSPCQRPAKHSQPFIVQKIVLLLMCSQERKFSLSLPAEYVF